MYFRISKFAILAFSVAALSCGEVRTPVDPVSDAVPPIPAIDSSRPAGRIVFGSRALARAKVVATSSSTIWSGVHVLQTAQAYLHAEEGGELNVSFGRYGNKGTVRVEDVSFVVAPNSIGGVDPVQENWHYIGMGVHSGMLIDEVFIGFQPSGMTFSPAATLSIHGVGFIDADNLVAYHLSDDGTVTVPTFTVETHGKKWAITIEVPGFSEYSVDDDEMNQEDEY